MKFPVLIAAALAGLAWSVGTLQAHEYWISPQRYQVQPGDDIVASVRVGSNMLGSTLIYSPDSVKRFELVEGGSTRQVKARLGDDPALVMRAGEAGLVVAVQTTGSTLITWDSWEKFTAFVEHKAFPGILEAHAARGLPQTGFSETFSRYAKSLIAVGDGAGADRVLGLRIEIVALANPYTDDLSGGMPFRVLLDGAPYANTQFQLFAKAPDGTISIVRYRTDSEGKVTVPVQPGTEYMADSVMLDPLPNDNVKAGAVWHSDWASLTFEVPAR